MIQSIIRRRLMIGAVCLPALPVGGSAASRPVIRLPVAANGPPVSERNAQGQYVGMMESALQTINAELNWQIDYTTVPWKRAQEYVRQGKLDALCTLPSPVRRGYVLFAAEPLIVSDGNWIFFAADNPRAAEMRQITSIDQLKTFQIALERGNAWPNDLMGEGWRTTEVEDIDLVGPMLRTHRVDLAFEIPEFMELTMRLTGGPPLEMHRLELLPGGYTPYTFGLRKSFPEADRLMVQFNAAHLRARTSGRIDQALAPFRRSQG